MNKYVVISVCLICGCGSSSPTNTGTTQIMDGGSDPNSVYSPESILCEVACENRERIGCIVYSYFPACMQFCLHAWNTGLVDPKCVASASTSNQVQACGMSCLESN